MRDRGLVGRIAHELADELPADLVDETTWDELVQARFDARRRETVELVRVREVESINPATGVLQRRMVEVEGELERRVGSDEKPSPAMIAFLNDRSRHTPPEARCETQAASLP